MKKTIVTAALAALLSAGALSAASAAPAQTNTGATAQQVDFRGHHQGGHHKDWHGRKRILSQRVIVRSLYRRGYRDIRNVSLVHGDYVLIARGYRGTVKLVVDGASGRILARHMLRNHHRPGLTFRGGNGNFSYSFGIR